MDEEQTKQLKNPLSTLWNVLGTTGGIISLSSMVQNWFDDLLQWKGFILALVESYRESIKSFETALELDPEYFEDTDPEHMAHLKAYEASRQGHRYEP